MECEWRRLRADELRERAHAQPIVILPVASLEQHGPHLPVETDTALAEAIALGTARALMARGEAALVLPVLWTGLSEHHMSFGGTVTLEHPAFFALVEGVVRSVARHGFRRIVLLNAHGGNETALRAIADDLTPRLGLPIVQLTYWYAAAAEIAKILEIQSGLTHACEAETSMMMAIRPELVATARIPTAPANLGPDLPGGVHRWRAIGARTASGALGHPEAARAEKGERLLAAIAGTLAARLADPDLWSLSFLAEPIR